MHHPCPSLKEGGENFNHRGCICGHPVPKAHSSRSDMHRTWQRHYLCHLCHLWSTPRGNGITRLGEALWRSTVRVDPCGSVVPFLSAHRIHHPCPSLKEGGENFNHRGCICGHPVPKAHSSRSDMHRTWQRHYLCHLCHLWSTPRGNGIIRAYPCASVVQLF